MRKILLLLLLALVVFVVLYRQRIFMWDPLGRVARDGVAQSGTRVMINYSNDVLVKDKSSGTGRWYLVQNWNKTAETPTAALKCIQYLACMTDADQASARALAVGSRGARGPFAGVTMTNRRVEFVDESGALVTVTIR